MRFPNITFRHLKARIGQEINSLGTQLVNNYTQRPVRILQPRTMQSDLIEQMLVRLDTRVSKLNQLFEFHKGQLARRQTTLGVDLSNL